MQPLSTNASGRILLSTVTDQAARRIVRRNNAEAGLRVEEDLVMQSIAEIRRTGFAETDAAISGEREAHAIATLIPRKGGAEPISLAIAGPKDRVMKRRTEITDIQRDYLHLTD